MKIERRDLNTNILNNVGGSARTSGLPLSFEGRIDFIKKKYPQPLEPAWFLETVQNGVPVSLILCEDALKEKIYELGFNECLFFEGEGEEPPLSWGITGEDRLHRKFICPCDISGRLLDAGVLWLLERYYFPLTGFVWRRRNRFQMEEIDWREAKVFIMDIEYGLKRFSKPGTKQLMSRLLELIVQSCFLDPVKLNDTGKYSQTDVVRLIQYDKAIDLFEEAFTSPTTSAPE